MRARRAPRCHWMLPANFRARTNVPRPIPTLATSHPPDRGATHPALRTHADSPSRVPTPVLRASSMIFVQAREFQLGDGGEYAIGVTE